MARPDIIVGLEIGTTKICAVVGEGREDASVRILGVGQTPSRGVRKGEIIDFSTVTQCVADALGDAEDKSGEEIRSVWVSVTGSHLQAFNSRGMTSLPHDRQEIDEDDLHEVELSAREVNLPGENTFLHSIIQKYYVDGQAGVLNPVGMLGNKLEADFHIIHGVQTRIQNTIRCIKELRIDVEDIVANSIASAEVILDANQRALGALVLDIGGGVTDYLAVVENCIRHSGVLAVGGDHVTNDISIGLRIPISKAEKVKVEEGSASLGTALPGEAFVLKDEAGFSGREVEREMLNRIVHARMKELFEIIRRQVEENVPFELLGAGVIITGGGSELRGIKAVAEEIFELPVSVGHAQSVAGPASAYEDPSLSTAIGLVKYAHAIQSSLQRSSLLEVIGDKFTGLLGKFRRTGR